MTAAVFTAELVKALAEDAEMLAGMHIFSLRALVDETDDAPRRRVEANCKELIFEDGL